MRVFVALFLVLSSVSGAGAAVDLNAICTDGTIFISVTIFNYEYPPEWVGLVIQRSWVGACGTETIITDPPLALPPHMEQIYHVVTEPVLEDVYLEVSDGYSPLGFGANGLLVYAPASVINA